jgi:Ca2+:H+ antiporter
MTSALAQRVWWHTIVPVVALLALILTWGRNVPFVILLGLGLVLAATVLSAVHHAEVVAARVGEPFGSLILAFTVTVIEVALIVTVMTTDPGGSQTLARDTIFAALMITCNGIIGLALVARTLRGGEATFNAAGPITGLSAIAVLATLSLVLPSFTTSTPGPTLSASQLTFTAIASLGIYLLFVFMQTIRHRDYFLPSPDQEKVLNPDEVHAEVPSVRMTTISLAFLFIALIAVVGLAKVTSPVIEAAIFNVGLPSAAVAVSIALLVLLPETIAAVRAARRGRIQTSLNLGYGSAMASIGLTIPAIVIVAWIMDFNLTLGIGPTSLVLLGITIITGFATVISGRATLLQGGLHLSLLAVFLILVAAP